MASELSKYYVVCVDDERELGDILLEQLKSTGCKAKWFPNGVECLRFLEDQSQQVALIISDLNMPEMDGFTLRDQVRNKWPDIPFAVLSANIDTETALKGLELKICAFLNKPHSIAQLKDLVNREVPLRTAALIENEELLKGFVEEAESNLENVEPLILRIGKQPPGLRYC